MRVRGDTQQRAFSLVGALSIAVKDKNGRLDTEERKAAREWLTTNGGFRPGSGGRGGAVDAAWPLVARPHADAD